jgi:hypothetical protein
MASSSLCSAKHPKMSPKFDIPLVNDKLMFLRRCRVGIALKRESAALMHFIGLPWSLF